MALIGGLAGLSLWALIEWLDDVLISPHLYLVVTTAVAGFFSVLLALAGPARIGVSVLAAAILAGLGAALIGWSSLRYDALDPFIEGSYALLAWGVFLFVATPIASAMLEVRGRWPDYAHLFDHSWNIVVRYAAAWIFVSIFWLVLFLSNALLEMVGITLIEDLIDIDAVPFALSGLMLGLALSVVHEMRAYVSPFLILRLLRLLLPLLVVVVAVFIAALPFRGLDGLFRNFSAATTLMAVALGAITLISTALDKNDREAVSAGWMKTATRVLALLLPVVSGLALYAVWLRFGQYGWTPDRVAAATAAGFALAYALVYAVSVVMGAGWMARIRAANVVMAALVVLVSCLWLTPLFNAEKISANSQLARWMRGGVTVGQMPLWEMARDWGQPGRAALAELDALPGEDTAELQVAITKARETDTFFEYDRETAVLDKSDRIEKLHGSISFRPENETLSLATLGTLGDYVFQDWEDVCIGAAPPGCVMVLSQFDPGERGLEGVMLLPRKGGLDTYDAVSLRVIDGNLVLGRYVDAMAGSGRVDLTQDDVRDVLNGNWRAAAPRKKALWIRGKEIFPKN